LLTLIKKELKCETKEILAEFFSFCLHNYNKKGLFLNLFIVGLVLPVELMSLRFA
jgi:hypothetical protein